MSYSLIKARSNSNGISWMTAYCSPPFHLFNVQWFSIRYIWSTIRFERLLWLRIIVAIVELQCILMCIIWWSEKMIGFGESSGFKLIGGLVNDEIVSFVAPFVNQMSYEMAVKGNVEIFIIFWTRTICSIEIQMKKQLGQFHESYMLCWLTLDNFLQPRNMFCRVMRKRVSHQVAMGHMCMEVHHTSRIRVLAMMISNRAMNCDFYWW